MNSTHSMSHPYTAQVSCISVTNLGHCRRYESHTTAHVFWMAVIYLEFMGLRFIAYNISSNQETESSEWCWAWPGATQDRIPKNLRAAIASSQNHVTSLQFANPITWSPWNVIFQHFKLYNSTKHSCNTRNGCENVESPPQPSNSRT